MRLRLCGARASEIATDSHAHDNSLYVTCDIHNQLIWMMIPVIEKISALFLPNLVDTSHKHLAARADGSFERFIKRWSVVNFFTCVTSAQGTSVKSNSPNQF